MTKEELKMAQDLNEKFWTAAVTRILAEVETKSETWNHPPTVQVRDAIVGIIRRMSVPRVLPH